MAYSSFINQSISTNLARVADKALQYAGTHADWTFFFTTIAALTFIGLDYVRWLDTIGRTEYILIKVKREEGEKGLI